VTQYGLQIIRGRFIPESGIAPDRACEVPELSGMNLLYSPGGGLPNGRVIGEAQLGTQQLEGGGAWFVDGDVREKVAV
jgi:hypothetical protein